MYLKPVASALVSLVLVLLAVTDSAIGQGTAFTYQGHLNVNGSAANGNFDMAFGLSTNNGTGGLVGALETNAAVAVSNGLFVTTLNFNNVFHGAPYWLEIGMRTNGSSGAFTTLLPLQPLTPTPYAITASNLTGTLQATQLSGALPSGVISGTFSNAVTITNSGNTLSGNGAGLTGVPTPSQTNYVFAFDTTDQAAATLNVFQTVTFTSTGNLGGWLFSTSGAFTASQTGLYLVSYEGHIQNLTTSAMTAALRVVTNGVTVIGAESVVSLPNGFYAGIAPLGKSFTVEIGAGTTMVLQFLANGSAQLAAGSIAGEFFPSASVTITRLQ
jgi:hypothetical protein